MSESNDKNQKLNTAKASSEAIVRLRYLFIFDDDSLGLKADVIENDFQGADDGLCQIIDMELGKFYLSDEWFDIRKVT